MPPSNQSTNKILRGDCRSLDFHKIAEIWIRKRHSSTGALHYKSCKSTHRVFLCRIVAFSKIVIFLKSASGMKVCSSSGTFEAASNTAFRRGSGREPRPQVADRCILAEVQRVPSSFSTGLEGTKNTAKTHLSVANTAPTSQLSS